MALAAAYGVYSFAFAPKRVAGTAATTTPSTSATTVDPTVREITQIQEGIGRTALSPLVRLAAARAGEEWSRTLFLWAPLPSELRDRDAARKQQQDAAQTALQETDASRKAAEDQERQRVAERQRRFSYTGYVCSAGRMYAVINGAVYEVGDRLDNVADCSLKSVSPENVVIEDHGRAITVLVPMLQDTTPGRLKPGGHDGP